MLFALRCCKGPVGVLAALLFWACHDAPRNNPFDPALTPPVELQVVLDDTAGTAILTWTRYEGQQPFREYRVLRKVSGLERVDTLAILGQVDQTSWVDTSMAQHVPYGYRVSVVNTSGLEVSTTPWEVRPVQLPAVVLERVDFDSRTATAHLQWTPYLGGQFAKYEVRRSTAELASQVIFSTPDPTATVFVDSNLVGATEYYYQVVVRTQRGEEVAGEQRRGAIHQVLATWPLPMDEGSFVRLYQEPGDRIAALIADTLRVRLLFFTPGGQLLEEQVLLDLPKLWKGFSPRFMDMVLGPDGQRYLSLVSASIGAQALGVLSLGAPLPAHPLFADRSQTLSGPEGKVQGQLALTGGSSGGTFDNVKVSSGGLPLFAEDFSGFPAGEIGGRVQNWEFGAKAKIQNGWLLNGTASHHSTEIWQDFRLEAEAINTSSSSQAVIQLGGDTWSRLVLKLDQSNKRVVLDWAFSPPAGSGLEPREAHFEESFTFVVGIPYHLSLEMVEGQLRAAIQSQVIWNKVPAKTDIWTSLAIRGTDLLLTVNKQAYTVSLQGEAAPQAKEFATGRVAELRTWEDPLAGGFFWIGACLPEVNQVLLGRFPVEGGLPATWSSFLLAPPLGPRAGPRAGFISYPLAFAVGPDGRVLVLDAGNSRILAFDPDRRFLTQWGRKGSLPGEFDFGEGIQAGDELDLAGSLVLDQEGNIYVADVVNRRIQKFAR